MPNIKSAKKRVIVNEKSKAINKAYKSELATGLKKYNAAVVAGDVEVVKALLPVTVSLVDESVTRGIIHKNKADRKKADINAKYNALVASKPAKEVKKTAKKVEVAQEEVKTEEAVEVKPAPRKRATKKTAEATETAEVKKAPARKRTVAKKADKE